MLPLLLATVLISTPLYPADRVHDPESLSTYMRQEFNYVPKKVGDDNWQSPTETKTIKKGVCIDFSLYTEEVLKELGYDAQAIAIYGKQKGELFFHAITVVKVEGGYKYFSNQFYSYFKTFNSITEIVEFECKDWEWYSNVKLPHEYYNTHTKSISGE